MLLMAGDLGGLMGTMDLPGFVADNDVEWASEIYLEAGRAIPSRGNRNAWI